MKQKNLLTTMLLLFALIVGSMSAWAQDEVTIASFTASDANTGTLNGWAINNSEYASAGGG